MRPGLLADNGAEASTSGYREQYNNSQRGRGRSDETQGLDSQPGKRARRENREFGAILRPGVPPSTPINSWRDPSKLSPPHRADDQDGHYVYELGENLSSRYKILSKMGEGTFGKVLECWDRKRKDYVAVKIVRNIDKYRHAAMIELEVLNTLERNDPTGSKHCVALLEWFDYRGHVCMVFEKLGLSLFDFLRKNSYRPFKVDVVQDFARQLLEAVAFMHDLRLVHTDLKPENILLRSSEMGRSSSAGSSRPSSSHAPASSDIKVIDFGSSTFEEAHHSSIVSTRHYRAPEVILGIPWSFPADVWSIGCILIELVTGEALFQTHENLEHLAMMEAVLGPVPESMVCAASKASARYFRHGRLAWPEDATNRKSVKAVQRMMQLRQLILDKGDKSTHPYADSIVDLLQSMLRYEPEQRLSPSRALQHPFLQLGSGSTDIAAASAGAAMAGGTPGRMMSPAQMTHTAVAGSRTVMDPVLQNKYQAGAPPGGYGYSTAVLENSARQPQFAQRQLQLYDEGGGGGGVSSASMGGGSSRRLSGRYAAGAVAGGPEPAGPSRTQQDSNLHSGYQQGSNLLQGSYQQENSYHAHGSNLLQGTSYGNQQQQQPQWGSLGGDADGVGEATAAATLSQLWGAPPAGGGGGSAAVQMSGGGTQVGRVSRGGDGGASYHGAAEVVDLEGAGYEEADGDYDGTDGGEQEGSSLEEGGGAEGADGSRAAPSGAANYTGNYGRNHDVIVLDDDDDGVGDGGDDGDDVAEGAGEAGGGSWVDQEVRQGWVGVRGSDGLQSRSFGGVAQLPPPLMRGYDFAPQPAVAYRR